eukprot:2129823-Rhodomonas_salina.1
MSAQGVDNSPGLFVPLSLPLCCRLHSSASTLTLTQRAWGCRMYCYVRVRQSACTATSRTSTCNFRLVCTRNAIPRLSISGWKRSIATQARYHATRLSNMFLCSATGPSQYTHYNIFGLEILHIHATRAESTADRLRLPHKLYGAPGLSLLISPRFPPLAPLHLAHLMVVRLGLQHLLFLLELRVLPA